MSEKEEHSNEKLRNIMMSILRSSLLYSSCSTKNTTALISPNHSSSPTIKLCSLHHSLPTSSAARFLLIIILLPSPSSFFFLCHLGAPSTPMYSSAACAAILMTHDPPPVVTNNFVAKANTTMLRVGGQNWWLGVDGSQNVPCVISQY